MSEPKEKSVRSVAESKANERKKRKKELKNMFSYRYYALLMLVCAVLRLRFNVHSVLSPTFRRQKRQGAMLVLSNHVSPFDFGFFSTPFLGRKVNFVVAENMMYSQPIFAKMIKGYRAITKKQFYADYTCIKNIKKYLDAGISVILCPEGKVSADGRTGPVAYSIAKLVKWLKYPVAGCLVKGAGITRPKWAHTSRTGRVECHVDMMFSKEEVETLSPEEIMKRIDCAMRHNEHVFQIENRLKFRGKDYAEGLENLLYVCPECGAEFALTAQGDVIKCGKCGFEARYAHTGEIVPVANASQCPARIDLWYDKEKSVVARQVREEGFLLSALVDLYTENEQGNGYKLVGGGTLSLDRENLVFLAEGPVDDEFGRLTFPVKNYVTVANLPGVSLDMYDEKHTYRMKFSAEKASTKYALCIEALNASRNT